MHLIQVLLPLYDNAGSRFSAKTFHHVRDQLAKEFAGVTVYSRAPAEGLWQADAHSIKHDDVVLFEVMVEHLDREWWREYREDLEVRFRQDQIIVRAHAIELL